MIEQTERWNRRLVKVQNKGCIYGCTRETDQIRKTKSKTAIYQFNQTDDNDGIQPNNLKLGLILQQNVYRDFSTRSRIPILYYQGGKVSFSSIYPRKVASAYVKTFLWYHIAHGTSARKVM